MLESLGYAEVPERERGGPDPVQHLLDPREGRRALRLAPVRGASAQAARPGARDRRRRLLGAVGQGPGVRAVPVRRRRVRPGPGAQARRVPDQRLAHRPGLLRVRGLHRPPAGQARPRRPGLGADLAGCNMKCSFCIVPTTRGREVSRPLRGARGRGRARSPPTACARSRCWARTSTPTARGLRPQRAQVLRAAARGRRDRGHRPHPLHEPAPRAHARGRHPRPRRARVASASTSTCRCSRARRAMLKAMRRTYDRERYLDRVALIREHVPDCALTTDIIVGFPGETEADFARDARGRRGGRLRRRVHVHLLAAPRTPRRPSSSTTSSRTRSQVERMERLVEVVQRRARERAQRFVGRTLDVLVEGTSRHDPSRLRGRTTPQQGRQLRRPGGAGRDRPGRDRRRPPARRSPASESLVARAPPDGVTVRYHEATCDRRTWLRSLPTRARGGRREATAWHRRSAGIASRCRHECRAEGHRLRGAAPTFYVRLRSRRAGLRRATTACAAATVAGARRRDEGRTRRAREAAVARHSYVAEGARTAHPTRSQRRQAACAERPSTRRDRRTRWLRSTRTRPSPAHARRTRGLAGRSGVYKAAIGRDGALGRTRGRDAAHRRRRRAPPASYANGIAATRDGQTLADRQARNDGAAASSGADPATGADDEIALDQPVTIGDGRAAPRQEARGSCATASTRSSRSSSSRDVSARPRPVTALEPIRRLDVPTTIAPFGARCYAGQCPLTAARTRSRPTTSVRAAGRARQARDGHRGHRGPTAD